MIEGGDRVLVCVSGGKDSLSLLHTLHQYQFMAKSKVAMSHKLITDKVIILPHAVGLSDSYCHCRM